jgi:hypothetical protein
MARLHGADATKHRFAGLGEGLEGGRLAPSKRVGGHLGELFRGESGAEVVGAARHAGFLLAQHGPVGALREGGKFVSANFKNPSRLARASAPSPVREGQGGRRRTSAGQRFVLTNLRVCGIERGDGQLVCGLGGRFAKLTLAIADFHRDSAVVFGVFAAFALGDLRVFQDLLPNAAGVEAGNVFRKHLDGGVDLPLQGGFMAQDGIEAFQPLGFRERGVFKELCLPAVQSAEPPGGRRDFFDVVLLQEIAGRKLLGPFGLKLGVAFGIFAEGGENNVAGKDAVGGGIAAGDGLAVLAFGSAGGGGRSGAGRHCGRHGRVPVPLSQAQTYVYYYSEYGRSCQGGGSRIEERGIEERGNKFLRCGRRRQVSAFADIREETGRGHVCVLRRWQGFGIMGDRQPSAFGRSS